MFVGFLDATFANRWIGRDGPTPWPPRSPDITPVDFFLWGYVKNKVFSTPVPDITNLKARCIRCGPDEERILDVVPREDGARNSG